MTKRPAIPTEIRVGPLVYAVSSDALELSKACRDQGTNLFGTCDHPALKITLAGDTAAGQQRETLLHETLHAVVTITGLGEEWGEAKEERVIRRLSPVLLALLRDNPEAVDYWMEDAG